MPARVDNTHPILKPYLALGMDLPHVEGQKSVTTDCPFCDKENKWNLNLLKGTWRCVYCNEGSEEDNGKVVRGGNISTFLRILWKKSREFECDYTSLARMRNVSPETLEAWGVTQNYLSGEWLVPAYSPERKLMTLYRYVEMGSKWRLLALPGSTHYLHGMPLFDSKKPEVYITEGWGDGMALWETLREEKKSYLVNVIAVPGAGVWRDEWSKVIDGKKVTYFYDNDHPKEKAGVLKAGAGYEGLRRIIQVLTKADNKPKTAQYLSWGGMDEPRSQSPRWV